jgi:hypothetical protein
MVRLRRLTSALLLVSLVGCERFVQPQSPEPEIYVPDAGSLGFDIISVQPDREFIATYTAHEKTAKFRIQLDPPNTSPKNFSVGKGRFLPESPSDPAALLSDLAKVLEARKIPKKVTRAASVPFEYVTFGENLSKGKNGFENSPGHWLVLKLFFGNDDAELFLNVNQAIKKGEFSIKDPDYGDYLIAELVKVF